MKNLFDLSTEITAAFTITAAATGETLVAFTEADAKGMQAYYDHKVELAPELAAKMKAMADAYAGAFHPTFRSITINADDDMTARGLFARIVPALAIAKMVSTKEQFEGAMTFGSTKLGLPPLTITQMAAHMEDVAETCAMLDAAMQATASVATKH